MERSVSCIAISNSQKFKYSDCFCIGEQQNKAPIITEQNKKNVHLLTIFVLFVIFCFICLSSHQFGCENLHMAGHAVVRLCDAVVGVGHPDGAVKNVVRGDGRGNSVNLAAEGGHSITVNRRVVNLHHAAERVVNHPAARHNFLVRCRSQANER